MKILGTGSALPELTVTNDDLSRIMDTSDAWISSRTGIRERRVLSGENLFDLACLKKIFRWIFVHTFNCTLIYKINFARIYTYSST